MPTDLEAFVSARGRKAKVAEIRKRIDDLGITYVYYQLLGHGPDHGQGRSGPALGDDR